MWGVGPLPRREPGRQQLCQLRKVSTNSPSHVHGGNLIGCDGNTISFPRTVRKQQAHSPKHLASTPQSQDILTSCCRQEETKRIERKVVPWTGSWHQKRKWGKAEEVWMRCRSKDTKFPLGGLTSGDLLHIVATLINDSMSSTWKTLTEQI